MFPLPGHLMCVAFLPRPFAISCVVLRLFVSDGSERCYMKVLELHKSPAEMSLRVSLSWDNGQFQCTHQLKHVSLEVLCNFKDVSA